MDSTDTPAAGLRRALRIALALAALLAAGAPGLRAQTAPKEPATLAELESAAAKEGRLDIAWGDTYGGAAGARRIQAGILRKFHVNLAIDYSPVANGAAYQNQVAEEVRSGQAASSDVFFHVRDLGLAAVAQAVDYRKYLPGLPDRVMFYDKRAIVAVTVMNAEIYNTKVVPAGKVPTGLADLLQPQWKGKIASSPYQGLFGNYLGLPAVLGHDRMVAFYQQLSAQLGGLMTCGELDRVASGEFAFFGLDCGDHEARLAQRRGQPLGIIHPREGTALSAFAPGIPLTAAHPNAARLFITYLMTREGQDLLWDVMGGDNEQLPGSHTAAIVAAERKRGVKFIDTYGLDVAHPELRDYQREINAIINQSR